ncbi:hypothetical protein MRY87_05425 [bacterium]|nr:hypothetical protein [bacterium]
MTLRENNPSDPTALLDTVRRKRRTGGFLGISLHQGTMNFLSLNGVYITFSPALLLWIGGYAVAATLLLPDIWLAAALVGCLLLVLLAQIAGHMIAGALFRSRPPSLVLSLTGVVDPSLVFRSFGEDDDLDTVKFNTVKFDTVKSDAAKHRSQEEEATEALVTEISSRMQAHRERRSLNRAPLRTVGASLATLFVVYLLASVFPPLAQAYISPNDLSTLDSLRSLFNALLWYSAVLFVAPFCPPHDLGASFRDHVVQGTVPIFLTTLLFSLLTGAGELSLGGEVFHPVAIGGYLLLTVCRSLWWRRVAFVGSCAQEVPLREAVIPFENMVTLSRGDSIEKAQVRAIQSCQDFFPVLNNSTLLGYVDRITLMRSGAILRDEISSELVTALMESRFLLCSEENALEFCLDPRTALPLFVYEKSDSTEEDGPLSIVGAVTSESLRDALLFHINSKDCDEENSET